MNEQLKAIECDECGRTYSSAIMHITIEGNVCNECWPKFAESVGLCESCGEPREAIYENNGFTEPDPTHYEIVGYKPCANCAYVEE